MQALVENIIVIVLVTLILLFETLAIHLGIQSRTVVVEKTLSTTEPAARYEAVYCRITFYYPGEDPASTAGNTASGAKLEWGSVAADPALFPYGTKIHIEGFHVNYTVTDTGAAVKSRKAAIKLGKTPMEKAAPVIDIYVDSKESAEFFAANTHPFCWVIVLSNPVED